MKSNPTAISSSPNKKGDPKSPLNLQDEGLPVSRFILFFCVMSAGLAADLITKHLAFGHYFDPAQAWQEPTWWVDGVFGLQTATNPGALFGMGKGYSWLFAIFSIIALIGIGGWLYVLGAAKDRWLNFTLGLVSGGILGNLFDRLGLGAGSDYPESIRDNVRDWILFRLEGVPFFDPWPNFNLADCWLVVGAGMLFFHALFLAPNDEDARETVTKSDLKP